MAINRLRVLGWREGAETGIFRLYRDGLNLGSGWVPLPGLNWAGMRLPFVAFARIIGDKGRVSADKGAYVRGVARTGLGAMDDVEPMAQHA